MRVAAPLTASAEAGPLAAAGAAEFYCGVMEEGSPSGYCPNARSSRAANFPSFDELASAVRAAAALGASVFFCANVPQGAGQTRRLKEDILKARAAGASGIVAADASLLPWLASAVPGAAVVVSTLAATLNRRSLDFLAAGGAARVVLDQALTLSEIAALSRHARVAGLELEVFSSTVTCVNISGDCPWHQWYPRAFGEPGEGDPARFAPCRAGLGVKVWKREGGTFRPTGVSRDHAAARPWPPCALCSLRWLKEAGVAVAKVAGRHLSLDRKLASVSLVKEYLAILDRSDLGETEAVAAGRALYRKSHGRDCSADLCFHPEVRRLRRAGP